MRAKGPVLVTASQTNSQKEFNSYESGQMPRRHIPADSERGTFAARGLDGFPYRIVYFTRGDEIVVVAYAHERRRPGYWKKRLSDLTE